jgi:drug/metabolite transporter (DMT)-like permease
MGFAGVLVLLRPGSVAFQPAAILLIGCAFFNALYYLLTRKVTGDSVHTTLFYSALSAPSASTLLLPLAASSAPLTGFTAVLLVAIGRVRGTGHWLMTRAYLIAPRRCSLRSRMRRWSGRPCSATFLFAQIPDRWSFVGMAVIVGSGVMLAAWSAGAPGSCGDFRERSVTIADSHSLLSRGDST